jgi:hypothetical protein
MSAFASESDWDVRVLRISNVPRAEMGNIFSDSNPMDVDGVFFRPSLSNWSQKNNIAHSTKIGIWPLRMIPSSHRRELFGIVRAKDHSVKI